MSVKAGLKRVVKTVRGKHGSYRRAYNVRAQGAMSTGQFLRKHGATWAATNAATGLAGGVGAMLGHRLAGRRGKIGGGAIGGYAAGSLGVAAGLGATKRMRALEKDSRRLGVGGHLVMSGVGVVSHVAGAAAGLFGANRVLRPQSIYRPPTQSSNTAKVRVELKRNPHGYVARTYGSRDTSRETFNAKWREV